MCLRAFVKVPVGQRLHSGGNLQHTVESHHWPESPVKTGIRTLLATGYTPDGERRPSHQGRDAETPREFGGNLTYTGSYPKALTCGNRIGMLCLIVILRVPFSDRILMRFVSHKPKLINALSLWGNLVGPEFKHISRVVFVWE